jgi:hypothetical protein
MAEEGASAVNETLVGSKLTEPIGSIDSVDNLPPWAEAGSATLVRTEPKATVIQRMWGWLHSNVRSHTLEQDKAGFTCQECPQPRRGFRKNWFTGEETSLRSQLLWRWISWETTYTDRCKECNRKYARFKRAHRAMKKIHDRGMDIWFITLTRPNITGVPGDSPFAQEADREQWIADFKKFRRTKIWKETFAGGYWFYEYTSNNPGDKIFAKDGTFIRQAQDYEMNGHLHILATSDGRIPMKEIAAQWGHRVDFRQPKKANDVLRYLRGYLVKCSTEGVNMRPFGDIHRSKQQETVEQV